MTFPSPIIWKAHIPSLTNVLYAQKSILSSREQAREKSFRFDKDRCTFRTSRILLRLLLSKYLDIKPTNIKLQYNEYWKPYVEPLNGNGIHFNLSHSHEWLVIAFNKKYEIGVDVEKVNSGNDLPIDICLSEAEKKTFSSLSTSSKPEYFYRIWTAKEAYFKMLGTGLNDTLSHSTFIGNSLHIKGEIVKDHHIQGFPVAPGYVGAYSTLDIASSPQYLNWKPEDLL